MASPLATTIVSEPQSAHAISGRTGKTWTPHARGLRNRHDYTATYGGDSAEAPAAAATDRNSGRLGAGSDWRSHKHITSVVFRTPPLRTDHQQQMKRKTEMDDQNTLLKCGR
ncbi:uncharacterized protein LOC142588004 isoform X2 [Dermacentor variabilis]|uniref:uncharacterized protein LOC142588004 isoform X2 n=1 Tax=Dermacentor variabilis TaxID=34621 RepID=UPI003F5BA5C4